jgi:predicted protein tyrosine phosphatase
MRAFWWYQENKIAGMARPGFNSFRWFEMSVEEAALMAWIGQHASDAANLESFRKHLQTYVPKTYKFHGVDQATGDKAVSVLHHNDGIAEVLERLMKKTQVVEAFSIQDDHLHLKMNNDRLQFEVGLLKEKGIDRVVTLTERHHGRAALENHFKLHHIAIEDLNAPNADQVYQLAELIKECEANQEVLAVHCLTGIGRTSTMLLAAHLVLGEPLEKLEAHIAQRNPIFSFTGPQGEFIRSFARSKS